MPYVTNLKGTKQVKVSLLKYRIDWDKRVASDFQFSVKQFLRKYWENQIGVCEEFKIPASRLRCDILCFGNKIAVEASGEQHFKYNKFFHGGNPLNLVASFRRDDIKRQWLTLNKFTLIEIIEEDLPHLSPEFIKEKFGVDII